MTDHSIHVILVEDDATLREAIVQALELEGFQVSDFASATAALSLATPDFAGVIISDIRLPGMDGLEFFEQLRALDNEMQVLFTTGHGDVEMAVGAMRKGAADFLTKPYPMADLIHSVRRAAATRELVMENRKLRQALQARPRDDLIGSSQQVERLRRMIAEVARADVDLLITGETGTGKNFIAQLVHSLSLRADRPFVTVDAGIFRHEDSELLLFGRDRAAGLSRTGLVERANGGTLLLDEIEEIPRQHRARILSLLENRTIMPVGAERARPVNLRVIATSRNPADLSNPGAEADLALLHRLSGITITLPPLSARREDIPELFRHFVNAFERESGTSAAGFGEQEWHHLTSHDWSGNIRELRAFARNFVLGLSRLAQPQAERHGPASFRDLVAGFERAVLEDALRQADGKVSQVQDHLQIPRKTLYDKLARHQLRPQDYRANRSPGR